MTTIPRPSLLSAFVSDSENTLISKHILAFERDAEKEEEEKWERRGRLER